MTALKREAIQLVEQMPDDQMPYVIQYIHRLKDQVLGAEQLSSDEAAVTTKMRAFLQLEKMIVPVSAELDYDKELSEARDERYGNIN